MSRAPATSWAVLLRSGQTVACKPLNLLTVDAVDVPAHNFIDLLIAGMSESLVGLLDNVVNVIIESDLAKR
jgi:hypothetical protein